jgi:hypothetical protein
MKFFCSFENFITGERRDLISTLDADELAEVEQARRDEGDDVARATAAAFVVMSAYKDLDAREWDHTGPPKLLN